MTRRRLLLFGLFAGFVALDVGVWLLWPPPSAISEENAERIRVGMALAKVEEILGGPERDESIEPATSDSQIDDSMYPRPRVWGANRFAIGVHLDSDGRVSCFRSVPRRRAPESPYDMLRRRLRR